MGTKTKIEFCHHTWSLWRGCTHRILPNGTPHEGCVRCYAEIMGKRNPQVLGSWGPNGLRPVGKYSYQRMPYHWNKACEKRGERERVFPSLMDPFEEGRPDLPRDLLFKTIDETLWLDWMLFTKRPDYVKQFWPGSFRKNVWLIYSASDQTSFDQLIDPLMACRDLVPVLGISAEPLVGPIDLSRFLDPVGFQCIDPDCTHRYRPFVNEDEYEQTVDHSPICRSCGQVGTWTGYESGIDWVVAGGESQGGARPMHPDWARSIRDQCRAASVPFFFKQWGEWLPGENYGEPLARWQDGNHGAHPLSHRESAEWRHFGIPGTHGAFSLRVGKKDAGRLLDGRTWDELPMVAA